MRIFSVVLLFIATAPSLAESFKYENLVDLIKNNHLQHLEEVLPLLPEEMRSHYTLMRKSRSLQEASDLGPRVIMFGRNAKLTCAFNGDSQQRGFDSLECFQFREESNSFDFRQIQFPTEENKLLEVQYSEPNRTVDKTISCSGCHMADPRPNWDSYSHWPGAYGEDDDNPQGDVGYSKFVAIRGGHPRYKWLIQDGYPEAPYMGGDHFDADNRPNLQLSEAIGRLMGLRDQRMMEQKLGELPTLAFSVGALQCLFTDEQKNRLKTSGIDLDRELDLANIFARLQVSARQWSTVIFNDPSAPSEAPWDHQFAYTFLKENVAMVTAQNLAGGDPGMAGALVKVKDYFAATYKGSDYRFYQDMNETVLGLDYFGGGYTDNRKYVCVELTRIFTDKFGSAR